MRIFPDKEASGFLTTLEKGWLSVLAAAPRTEELLAVAGEVDERRTLRVSNTFSSFFYKEYEDSYYPAEHEVVLLHLITATALVQESRCQDAQVELRRATFYLQSQYDDARPAFDHAGLRIWSATLWAHCGAWDTARIDLRVAGRLSGNAALAALAERKAPPPALLLAFGGMGPEVRQHAKRLNRVELVQTPDPTAVELKVTDFASPSVHLAGAATGDFYRRSLERQRLLENVVETSQTAVDGTTYGLASGTIVVAAAVPSFALITTGACLAVGGSGAGIYVGVKTGVAELGVLVAGLGIAGGGAMIGYGRSLMPEGMSSSEQVFKGGIDRSQSFRYQRFIPDVIQLAWSDGGEVLPRAAHAFLIRFYRSAQGLSAESPKGHQPGGVGLSMYFLASPEKIIPAKVPIALGPDSAVKGHAAHYLLSVQLLGKEAEAACEGADNPAHQVLRLPALAELKAALAVMPPVTGDQRAREFWYRSADRACRSCMQRLAARGSIRVVSGRLGSFAFPCRPRQSLDTLQRSQLLRTSRPSPFDSRSRRKTPELAAALGIQRIEAVVIAFHVDDTADARQI